MAVFESKNGNDFKLYSFMKTYKIIFSPTGGTEKATNAIIHAYASGRPNANNKKQLCHFGEKVLEKAAKSHVRESHV